MLNRLLLKGIVLVASMWLVFYLSSMNVPYLALVPVIAFYLFFFCMDGIFFLRKAGLCFAVSLVYPVFVYYMEVIDGGGTSREFFYKLNYCCESMYERIFVWLDILWLLLVASFFLSFYLVWLTMCFVVVTSFLDVSKND